MCLPPLPPPTTTPSPSSAAANAPRTPLRPTRPCLHRGAISTADAPHGPNRDPPGQEWLRSNSNPIDSLLRTFFWLKNLPGLLSIDGACPVRLCLVPHIPFTVTWPMSPCDSVRSPPSAAAQTLLRVRPRPSHPSLHPSRPPICGSCRPSHLPTRSPDIPHAHMLIFPLLPSQSPVRS